MLLKVDVELGIENCQAERSRLLIIAYHALRSFQYGNHCVDLARTAADEIEKELIRINYEGIRR